VLRCRDATARASALLDGELPLRERLALRLHLAVCGKCRRFHRQLHGLVGSLRRRTEDPSSSVSPEFVDRVMDRIETRD